MSMLKELREFAVKGNAIDMAVGIIIGGAFGKIVSSLVNDVIMPPIGQLTGGVDFSELFFTLGSGTYDSLTAAEGAGAAIMRYGAFIQTVIDFAIIALVIFMMVRVMNRLRTSEEKKPASPPEPSAEVKLLTEIRDSLKAG